VFDEKGKRGKAGLRGIRGPRGEKVRVQRFYQLGI